MGEHPLDRTALLIELDAFPGADHADLIESLLGTSARISVDRASATSPAGQTAVIATFIALAQMGLAIDLDVPEVPLLPAQPPLEGERLGEALADLVADMIQPVTSVGRPDLEIAIGEVPAAASAFRVTGGDWSASVAVGGEPRRWEGTGPSGAALAGLLAGAAALPLALRRIESRLERRAPDHLRALHPTATVSLPALELDPVEVGEVDVISAGAITNATLFTLLRVKRLRGALRIFDDDRVGVTNLNRYALVRRREVGRHKVDVLEVAATEHLEVRGVAERFSESSGKVLAQRVLVGVDDIPSRWAVQREAPGWVHVGATSHFEVMATSHPPGEACAGCSHPHGGEVPVGEIPTISIASQLAGQLQAHALLARATGQPVPSWYAWANNLGGTIGLHRFEPTPSATCPVPCCASAAPDVARN